MLTRAWLTSVDIETVDEHAAIEEQLQDEIVATEPAVAEDVDLARRTSGRNRRARPRCDG